jgi:hypothetical protein
MYRWVTLCCILSNPVIAQSVGYSGGNSTFAVNPVDCAAGQCAYDLEANGNLVCVPTGSGRKYVFGGGTAQGSSSTHYVGTYGGFHIANPQRAPVSRACVVREFMATVGQIGTLGDDWRVELLTANLDGTGSVTTTICTIQPPAYSCSASGLAISLDAGDTAGVRFVQLGSNPNTQSSQWSAYCTY